MVRFIQPNFMKMACHEIAAVAMLLRNDEGKVGLTMTSIGKNPNDTAKQRNKT